VKEGEQRRGRRRGGEREEGGREEEREGEGEQNTPTLSLPHPCQWALNW
jgi:hypothetical protein